MATSRSAVGTARPRGRTNGRNTTRASARRAVAMNELSMPPSPVSRVLIRPGENAQIRETSSSGHMVLRRAKLERLRLEDDHRFAVDPRRVEAPVLHGGDGGSGEFRIGRGDGDGHAR